MNHKVFILKTLVSHQKLLPVYNLFGHKLKIPRKKVVAYKKILS